jgi:hypothetical protein
MSRRIAAAAATRRSLVGGGEFGWGMSFSRSNFGGGRGGEIGEEAFPAERAHGERSWAGS